MRVADALIDSVCSGPLAGGSFQHLEGRLVLQMVSRGTWCFSRPDGPRATAAAGRFLARYNDRPLHFVAGPRSSVTMLSLPGDELRSLVGGGGITGSTCAAPLLMLASHLKTVSNVIGDLSPASVLAARDATIELVKGILVDAVDGGERQLAPAVAGAAQRLADDLLADPDLSPDLVARRLGVSVRALHRAFHSQGETLMAYVRRRRLERAMDDLAGPGPRLSVSEAAARWCFADSSHLIRACRTRYGLTPTEFARRGAGPG